MPACAHGWWCCALCARTVKCVYDGNWWGGAIGARTRTLWANPQVLFIHSCVQPNLHRSALHAHPTGHRLHTTCTMRFSHAFVCGLMRCCKVRELHAGIEEKRASSYPLTHTLMLPTDYSFPSTAFQLTIKKIKNILQ